MKKILSLIVIVVCSFSVFSYDIALVENANTDMQLKLSKEFDRLFNIDKKTVVIFGKNSNSFENVHIKKLDNWDSQSHYYLLFPMSDQGTNSITQYGKVLHDSGSFIIFKSFYRSLDGYTAFSPFEILNFSAYLSPQNRKGNDYF